MTFGERLKKCMLKKHMSQKQLAQISNCATTTMSAYTLDKRQPDMGMMITLAEALDTSVQYLATGKTFFTDTELARLAVTLKDPMLHSAFEKLTQLSSEDLDLAIGLIDAILKRQKNFAQRA